MTRERRDKLECEARQANEAWGSITLGMSGPSGFRAGGGGDGPSLAPSRRHCGLDTTAYHRWNYCLSRHAGLRTVEDESMAPLPRNAIYSGRKWPIIHPSHLFVSFLFNFFFSYSIFFSCSLYAGTAVSGVEGKGESS